ncbi:addiction module protein [Uliginosibacterium sediminicola]|uniref:Addiction module protein n=1 Tax=Uliginosibacterium sediminicola TaxID=2024550 RepID=A0ABU9YU05_9RHOO
MSLPVQTLLAEAQHLPRHELDELISGLLARRDADDTPEAVAAAWDEEIARRLTEIDRGEVEWIPGEQVFAEINGLLGKAGK